MVTFPADNELKLGWHQRVQADVDGTETSFLELRQQAGEVDAIGGDADGPQPLQPMELGCRKRGGGISLLALGEAKRGLNPSNMDGPQPPRLSLIRNKNKNNDKTNQKIKH